jgi:hypothetical protein
LALLPLSGLFETPDNTPIWGLFRPLIHSHYFMIKVARVFGGFTSSGVPKFLPQPLLLARLNGSGIEVFWIDSRWLGAVFDLMATLALPALLLGTPTAWLAIP